MSVSLREQESRLLTDAAQLRRRPDRRVRQEVRDGMAVVAFSVGASTFLALSLTVLARWAG